MNSRKIMFGLLVCGLLAQGPLPAATPGATSAQASRPGKAAIASAHFLATEAGHEILAQGGARPALESFKAFRGREPTIDALLRHNGMA